MLDKIKAWCMHSATIFLSYMQALSGTFIIALPIAADLLADDTVKAQLQSWIPGNRWGIALIMIGVVTFLARIRSIVWP